MERRFAFGENSLTKGEGVLLNLSVLTLIGILLVVIVSQWRSWPESGPQIGLLAIFALVFLRLPNQVTPRQMHLYLSVQTLIIGISLAQASIFIFLFFILSVQAMVSLPTRAGLRWIALFAVVTGVGNLLNNPDLWNSLLNTVVNAAGFLFFGAFGNALRRAEAARAESQQLLSDLQDAHRQLQAYAERVETLAVAEERNRLSREMHDTLGHRLTVSIVQLEGAGRLIDRDPVHAAQMVKTVREQLVEGLAELRQTLAALRDPLAVGVSLSKMLQMLADEFSQATQIEIQTHIPNPLPDLLEAQRNAIYRTAQEGLTNVQRHARASCVTLTVKSTPEHIHMIIEDNGIGYDPANGASGIGLHGMRERANYLHGEFEIESQPGQGTTLNLILPLHKEDIHA
ncbi:MAG: sensor histidine kinase [Caldilineaceae bacterium]|nr:sensor histidine kinase [Caldilineaceae bacterium]